jgi:opacity protein-like surface antigen
VNLGAGRNSSGFFELGGPQGLLAFPAGEFFRSDNWGFTIGGQAGYNWQFGNVVAGVEADINWLDGKTSATLDSPFHSLPVSASTEMDWFATFRGRLGLAFSRTLIYATGGLAVAHVSNEWGLAGIEPRFRYDDTRSTWVVGGGLEYMMTKNWTVRVEGLFADFGDTPITTISGPALGGTYNSKFTHKLTTVRGALNWKW